MPRRRLVNRVQINREVILWREYSNKRAQEMLLSLCGPCVSYVRGWGGGYLHIKVAGLVRRSLLGLKFAIRVLFSGYTFFR